jgi:hypothetical protein
LLPLLRLVLGFAEQFVQAGAEPGEGFQLDAGTSEGAGD